MVVRNFKTLAKPIATWVLGFLFFTGKAQDVQLIYHEGKCIGVRCESCSANIEVRLSTQPTTIMGKVEYRAESPTFYPIIPFDPQLTYELWDNSQLIQGFSPAARELGTTQITGIFPMDSILPANLLKMHLTFSAPMSVGNSYQYIHFYEGDNEVYPLLDLQPELWNDDRTTLTLWLDPGRIKRDLLRQKRLGTPLHSDRTYRMIIDSTWVDKSGTTLMSGAQRQFTTRDADREMPSPTNWSIEPPTGPSAPVTLHFDESMDYLLLHNAIYVSNGESIIEGHSTIPDNQRQWQFVPDQSWSANTDYHVVVESRLEDLAGNNLSRLFDRDVEQTNNGSTQDIVFNFRPRLEE